MNMWPNNGFHEHESFKHNQSNLYQGQGNYRQPFLDDGYIPFSPVPFAPQYFLHQSQSQGIPYNPPLTGSGQSTPGEYEPQIDHYDPGSVIQNDILSSDGPEQYGQSRQVAASQGAVRPALNARAEELKTQLMKIKDRGKSGTPPVSTSVSNPSRSKVTAPVYESSKISCEDKTTTALHPSGVIDEDLNVLISKAKTAAHIEKGGNQSNLNIERPPQPSSSQSAKENTVAVAEDSSAKVSKQAVNNPNSHEPILRKDMNRYNENEVLSDAPEGEIEKHSKAETSRPPSGTKGFRISTKQNKEPEQVLRKLRDEESWETPLSQENRETSPHGGGAARASAPQFHDDRNDEADERPMRNLYPSNNRYERNHQSEADHRSYSKRDTRDYDEERRKQQSKHNIDREEQVVRKSEVPTLAQLLTLDEDLRDWLDITRYHHVEYRTKTLNRRRAIAALDAQKAKLLAEMEMEERGGLQTITNSQSTVSGMLPPPIPSKLSTNTPSSAVAPFSKKDDNVPIRSGQEQSSSTSMNQETALKRTYSEYRESQDKVSADKIGHNDEQGRGIRIKSEHQSEEQRTGSSDYDSARRRSLSPDYRSDSHGKRDAHSETHSRDQGRSFSHNRDMSPGEFAYEKRPRARSRSYEFPSPDEQNRVFWKDPEYVPRGTYVERGNYRGRAYDPNYKGRGGGRGRGKTWNEFGEARFEQRDVSQVQSRINRLASLKPYKDPNPLEKGGKGGTRYFIVKSFNEENVVRCIEDSIWTTKKENGKIFNTAFLKCKNVIFVFSANHSRAFQGYARMESSPGTETAPPWMNSINWESAGAFKVKWLCVANTRFGRVGHLKNSLNENRPVLVGRDGQEIEERCGDELLRLIDEEADRLLARSLRDAVATLWDD